MKKHRSIGKWIVGIIVAFLILSYLTGVVPVIIAEGRARKTDSETLLSEIEPDIEKQKREQAERTVPECVLYIDDNEEALEKRIKLIDSAKETVYFSTFDLQVDNSGKKLIKAMADAAERGVKVYVLLDGYHAQRSMPGNRDFLSFAALDGVKVKIYNPIEFLKPWESNYRLHEKMIVVDEKAYIAGGRNSNDLFLGQGKGKSHRKNRDRDLLVITPEDPSGKGSSKRMAEGFRELWNQPFNREFEGRANGKNKGSSKPGKRYDLENLYEGTVPVDSIVLMFSEPGNVCKKPTLWDAMISSMKKGREVLIETPYYMADGKMERDIENLGSTGERTVNMILNSPDTSANPWGGSCLLFKRPFRNNKGINLFEYYGKHASHTKTVLVDDSLSLVGSFNMDMRSTYLDTELIMAVKSPELNRALKKEAESRMKNSIKNGEKTENSGNIKKNYLKRLLLVFMFIPDLLFFPLL